MTKQRAFLELLIASAVWGFCFIAIVWSLKDLSPTQVILVRFTIAFIIGEVIILFSDFKNYFSKGLISDFKNALPAAVLLTGHLLLQTIGLQYTTATKSGFLTTLYVLFVPLMNDWFFKIKSDFRLYFYILIAIIGTFLLLGVDLAGFNKGDSWTLACAIVGALQIIFIGKIAPQTRNTFRFNNFQSFWCVVFLFPVSLWKNEIPVLFSHQLSIIGVFILGVGGSMLGFFLQLRAQKVLVPTTASILFLLESPFAFTFAFLFLGETLKGVQILGALLILYASFLTIKWEARTT